MKNLKLMYSSKNVSGVYFVKYYQVKNDVFGDFLGKKCGKLAVLAPFSYITGSLEGLFDFFGSPPPPPQGRALPLPIVCAPSRSRAALVVSSSF
jgi:hypothetical protein